MIAQQTPQMMETPLSDRERLDDPGPDGVVDAVHECRERASVAITSQAAFDEAMKQTLTTCGRGITSSYKLVSSALERTAKCRVCFKGRRAP